ncbi:MAG: putative Rossmann fold flavoprotein [Planctomycetota bacterium]|jgi:predicted Rossmann fold flavoprotein
MSTSLPEKTDVLIIGAGAAGLMCAITAGQRARSVLVVEHANKVGKKILMSGGGRCNFTNLHTEAHNFISQNAHFCKSALSRYTPGDFIALVNKHKIAYHEKKLGQLFCDNKSKDILDMLLKESQEAGVKVRTHCVIGKVNPLTDGFELVSNLGTVKCHSLVVASGGLSIPKMGATAFGYELAKQFGLNLVPGRAGLVPFTLDKIVLDKLVQLSGSSLEVIAKCGEMSFREKLLFTHRGLSGPAMLQISSYWRPGDELILDLLPDINFFEVLQARQQSRPRSELKSIAAEFMSKNMSQALIDLWFGEMNFSSKPVSQFTRSQLQAIADQFHRWTLKPSGTEGYRTAEVTLGGVNTEELSSKTMESVKQQSLYFIGEVVDVTGQLGGFNFQWAWASGVAAGGFV